MGGPMKTWILRETGKIEVPTDEYIEINGRPTFIFAGQLQNKYPILTLEVFDSDPMEGIRAVLKEYQERFPETVTVDDKQGVEVAIYFLNKFINAARKAVEGK
jgi:hypothetical protein